ncbi:type III secretion system protein HrcU [Caballeronia fortuita]|uniref:Type III secretion system protein HrcU n=1 Tax=Caballeronia fortuita TaxID=1777138 RepID=A0A158BBN0_9BURK|nr:EscU/YscU/HrcU family type III secretion system export apparatus switch protein [Caballeronia fortuita]SAK67453.1 type III secretion system protein HrcU [Caballeronia fortuita]
MSDKTEKPSQRRLQRARKEGDIPKSAHLSTAVSGGLWWLLMTFQAPNLFASFVRMVQTCVSIDADRSLDWRLKAVLSAAADPGRAALTMSVCGLIAAVVPELVQARGLIAFKRVAPDLRRLNPIEGFKNLFGLKALLDTGLMLIQMTVLSYVAWNAISAWLAHVGPLYSLEPLSQLALATQAHSRLLAMVALSQLAPAAADYGIQRMLHKRRLRMNKDELKRENREEEGDPLVKGRRRALHRSINDKS